jgi:hypothetical protein
MRTGDFLAITQKGGHWCRAAASLEGRVPDGVRKALLPRSQDWILERNRPLQAFRKLEDT